MSRHVVARVDELPLGSGKLVTAKGRPIVIFNVEGEIVRCPWHGWEFDVKTGQSYCDPSRLRARPFTVAVEPGARVVEGPYVAETFPVSIEDDYVIIEA